MDVDKRMKFYFDNPTNSFAIDRVVTNLEKYMPDGLVRIASKQEADLIILHVFGRNHHITREAQSILGQRKQYAVIQYALKSTRNPDPKDWEILWGNAKIVWSYYDLGDNFYHAPLAADPEVFYKMDLDRNYLVGTLGVKECYQAECFGEVHLAAFQAQGKVIHVGEQFISNPAVRYVSGISDKELNEIYNQCNWFACLRRKEGFEVTTVEALLCGARPIMFDTPNYRQWFDGLVEFIPESSVEKTVSNLRRIFRGKPHPVTEDEIEEIKRRFNWKKIIEGFWQRCTT
jgi:hypothetical protein